MVSFVGPSRERVPPGVLPKTLRPGHGLHPPRDPSFASPGKEETPAGKSRVRRLRSTSPLRGKGSAGVWRPRYTLAPRVVVLLHLEHGFAARLRATSRRWV